MTMDDERLITCMNPGDFAGSGDTAMLSLEEVAGIIRDNPELAQTTEELREYAASHTDGEANRKKSAVMPIMQFHSVCSPTRHSDNVVRETGYMCMDIDEYDGDYAELAGVLWNDPAFNPCLVFRSPRGKLKAVARRPDDGTPFREAYGSALLWLLDRHGIRCDASCNDIVRNCYMSHDSDALCDPSRVCGAEVTGGWDAERYAAEFGKAEDSSPEARAGAANRCSAILDMLARDGDGFPVYDTSTRLTIGKRSDGTAQWEVAGLAGNDLKLRINAAAMAMFNDDAARAQDFIDTVFTDHGDVWSACRYHRGYSVKPEVMRWLVRKCGFRVKTEYL